MIFKEFMMTTALLQSVCLFVSRPFVFFRVHELLKYKKYLPDKNDWDKNITYIKYCRYSFY